MPSNFNNDWRRGGRASFILCTLLLGVVFCGSYLTYRYGRDTLDAAIGKRIARDLDVATHTAEGEIRKIVEDIESWVQQPAMACILDDDQDLQIAKLFEVLVQRAESLTELTCRGNTGEVITSTNAARMHDAFAPTDELLARLRLGQRYEIVLIDQGVLVIVPVFIEFDQREFIGTVEAIAEPYGFLIEQPNQWVGLTEGSGNVIASRGTLTSAHLPIQANGVPESDSVAVLKGEVELPSGGMGPTWCMTVAEPRAALYRPVDVLSTTFWLMSAGTAVAIVVLVGAYSARRQVLVNHLAQRTDELECQTEELTSQTEELATLNDALTTAKAKAVSSAKAKSEFLANMSHEIRTPMTAILGFSESLLDPEMTAADQLDAVHTIRRNGEYLLSIINDILDLSKIEAGKMTVERLACSPCELLHEVLSLVRVSADAKGLTTNIEYIGPMPKTIQTDPTRLRQILVNLLGNAIKFTETGSVRLIAQCSTTNHKSCLQIDVIDTGAGMSPDQAANLFQPFTQADASTTRRFGGTGLGLTISKRLANILGGDIRLSETHPEYGTRFRVTVATGSLVDVAMLESPQSAAEAAPERSQPQDRANSLALEGCRILLAEDGPDNQRLISFVLRKEGAEVSVAGDGQLAIEAISAANAATTPFNVVLMDMQMPNMDGYEATRRLRHDGHAGPIIALTAHAMAGDMHKCLAAGCDHYATKPVDRRKLVNLIRHCVARTHQLNRGLQIPARD